ncbi:MAG: hypothetical protein ABI220_03795 [Candidatus Saccharimonadales bacterium]
MATPKNLGGVTVYVTRNRTDPIRLQSHVSKMLKDSDNFDNDYVPQPDWAGVSAEVWQELAGIDPDDRTENLVTDMYSGERVSNRAQDIATNTLLSLSHIDWAERPEDERATVINYMQRVLGGMGITLVHESDQNG